MTSQPPPPPPEGDAPPPPAPPEGAAAPPSGAVATAPQGPTPVPGEWGGPPPIDYPVRLDVVRQTEYGRFLPLIKWLLVIPHAIALVFVLIGAFFAIVASWFAVLFTGRYPEGMFRFVVGANRWMTRVNAYQYLMVDKYPPFSLEDDPEYPVRFDIEYPPDMPRWRPLLSGILVLPHYIALLVLYLGGLFIWWIPFWTILFGKNYPQWIFNYSVAVLRWTARVNAYGYWMVKPYPPFTLA